MILGCQKLLHGADDRGLKARWRPRGLQVRGIDRGLWSCHSVDSHALTVDIHGHLRPIERRTSRARVVCLVSVCFHGLQKVLLGRDWQLASV